MDKAIRFLGVCILLATIIVSGVQIYLRYYDTCYISAADRYYFGVSEDGYIRSAADKYTGKVFSDHYEYGEIPWKFR